MIKINLALRKQPSALVGDKKSNILFSKSPNASNDAFKDLPIKKIVTVVLSCLIANYTLDNYKEEVLGEKKKVHDKVLSEQAKLKEQIKDIKKFEDIKKLLESDEKLIRTKLEVIRTLLSDRGNPPRLLKSISNTIPKEIWLTEINLSENDSTVKGYSVGLSSVSDFMKELSKTPAFTNITLRSTVSTKDETGLEVASFELGGQKK